jgi:hypothetical protein
MALSAEGRRSVTRPCALNEVAVRKTSNHRQKAVFVSTGMPTRDRSGQSNGVYSRFRVSLVRQALRAAVLGITTAFNT